MIPTNRFTRRRWLQCALGSLPIGQLLGIRAATASAHPGPGPLKMGRSLPSAGPAIRIWYGTHQIFGRLGNPQRWVNILGRVESSAELVSLTYTLNGSSPQRLSIGPDNRRLVAAGDFNIELDRKELENGDNAVILTAVDSAGNRTVEQVNVAYRRGNQWPLPYTIQWSATSDIASVAEVVDGLWKLEKDGIRPSEIGYDRIIAFGDMSWQDYEVSVPITIHGYDMAAFSPINTGPMVGLVVRWQGHYKWDNRQPRWGTWPIGALALYGWNVADSGEVRLELQGNRTKTIQKGSSGRQLTPGARYIFSLEARSRPGQTSFYRFKVWADGSRTERWELSGPGFSGENEQGSALLVAHCTEATFGDVSVRRI
jgi:hypothetical protein